MSIATSLSEPVFTTDYENQSEIKTTKMWPPAYFSFQVVQIKSYYIPFSGIFDADFKNP